MISAANNMILLRRFAALFFAESLLPPEPLPLPERRGPPALSAYLLELPALSPYLLALPELSECLRELPMLSARLRVPPSLSAYLLELPALSLYLISPAFLDLPALLA